MSTDSFSKRANKASLSQSVVLVSFYGLIVYFGVISMTALESIRFTSFIIWVLQIAPLAPFAWGLHKQYKRSYLWLSLVVLLYFMHGVLVAFDPERRMQGSVQILLCISLFVALLAHLRLSRE